MSTRGDVDRVELLEGFSDLLVFRPLLPSPAHGHAIARNIEQGSLCPALQRLIKRGWTLARASIGILHAAGQEGRS
jgi:hypothetical protein